MYKTEKTIVIYAQTPGADINDISVSIEGEADIILIEGKKNSAKLFCFIKDGWAGRIFFA